MDWIGTTNRQRFNWSGRSSASGFGDFVSTEKHKSSRNVQFSRNAIPSDTETEYEEIDNLTFNTKGTKSDRPKVNPVVTTVNSLLGSIVGDVQKEFAYIFSIGGDPMTPYTDDDVRRTALVSRLILISIQILGSLTVPQHVNDGFKTPLDVSANGAFDSMVNSTFGGLANWDGQYFLHIATKGYTHENTMAFFPLFPLVVGYLSSIIHFVLFPVITYHSLTLVTGTIFNLWCFQNAALTLSKIVQLQTGDRAKYILPTVMLLFCYNPASIFFSAFYSESLFALLTFSCILELYKRNLTKAIMYASLGCICRSNGLLNFGLIAVAALAQVTSEIRSDQPKKSPFPRTPPESAQKLWLAAGRKLAKIGGMCLIGISPFLCFQAYCVIHFCSDARSSSLPDFCFYDVLPYTYIQKANWNVGFLQYFQLKQIPNFILASPALMTLGFESKRHAKMQGIELLDKLKNSKQDFYWNILELTLAFHGIFLTVFCLLCIHVQVSTRMIMSACPYIYVYIAQKLTDERLLFLERLISWMPVTTFIQLWFSMYFLVGTVGFSVGYPWT